MLRSPTATLVFSFTLFIMFVLFYGHYVDQRALAGTYSKGLEDLVGAKFYCPHAVSDGNQRIRIRQKTLEFSSTVLCYLKHWKNTLNGS